ncbi:hypothetical protein POI8812_01214 [Pontivivens insulae]|uniref:Uncharacterized protein n=1 Tax=Pontivivens insulae TaxID=1639689 RepID=A0A2R8A9I5_9RHOB|nr:hypothetical protein DFR53_1951 [Pontivivens insulae]SPF28911.1 hypothetical protein POI8812_01214 [Pontivivens insulae]
MAQLGQIKPPIADCEDASMVVRQLKNGRLAWGTPAAQSRGVFLAFNLVQPTEPLSVKTQARSSGLRS